jgi:hypothetical protein
MLAVGIHDDDGRAARHGEAGGDGRLLAEIAGEADIAHMRIVGRHPAHGFTRLVGRAVVDDDDLRRDVQCPQLRADLFDQHGQGGALIMRRQDDRHGFVGRFRHNSKPGRD